MPALKDFDAARLERERERDPVRFQLGGETFSLIPRIPLGDSFDLADAPEPAPETLGESVRALTRFIDRVLIDDDRARWAELLRRRDDPIDAWAIIDLGTWIAEQYAARPTVRSTGSSSEQPAGGPRSNEDGSPAPEGTSPT